MRDAYGALLALTADDGDAAALETLSRVKAEFESGQPFFADAVFEEMAVRQNRDRLHREHLERLVAEHQVEARKNAAAARKNAAAKSDLEAQLAAAQHEFRALSAEKAALEKTALEKTALARQLAKLKERNKALEAQGGYLLAGLIAHGTSMLHRRLSEPTNGLPGGISRGALFGASCQA